MPLRDSSGIGERIPRELIDADFTVAFSLVEMANDELQRGNAKTTSQLLQNAERSLNSIRERLRRLTPSQQEMFEPRCAELSRAIELVKTHDSGIEPES